MDRAPHPPWHLIAQPAPLFDGYEDEASYVPLVVLVSIPSATEDFPPIPSLPIKSRLVMHFPVASESHIHITAMPKPLNSPPVEALSKLIILGIPICALSAAGGVAMRGDVILGPGPVLLDPPAGPATGLLVCPAVRLRRVPELLSVFRDITMAIAALMGIPSLGSTLRETIAFVVTAPSHVHLTPTLKPSPASTRPVSLSPWPAILGICAAVLPLSFPSTIKQITALPAAVLSLGIGLRDTI